MATLRDGGVDHEHVEMAEGVPRLDRHPFGMLELAEIGDPHARAGRCRQHTVEDLSEAILAPGDDADGGAPPGELTRQRGADARRGAGDEDVAPLDLHEPNVADGAATASQNEPERSSR